MVLMHNGEGAKINRNNKIRIENDGDGDSCTRASFASQVLEVLEERDSKWILGLIAYNVVIIYYLCSWVTSTNSIALIAYINTIFFNVLALLVCLISIWVQLNGSANRQSRKNDTDSTPIFGRITSASFSRYPEYQKYFADRLQITSEKCQQSKAQGESICGDGIENREKRCTEVTNVESFDRCSLSSLGLERYEVLALLISSCLSLVAGSLVSVEVVARLGDQPIVHTGRLGLGALLGFLAHLGTVIAYPDAGLNHVVCKALPCPTLKECNPILGGNFISAVILCGTHLIIHFWDIHITDTAAAFAVIGLTATSMLPLAFYTLNIILQKLPIHMSEQLDKCLREALIIDGVLEFRNEKFWTKSFGKLAGSLQVRIRGNANENHVLESVVHRLSRIVSTLSVQEFREPRIIDVAFNRPVEYYINEILPQIASREEQLTHQEIDKDVEVINIDDILRFEDSQKLNKSKFTDNRDKKPARTLTIYKNDNVRVKDHLYRGDPLRKNALLYGTKIDYENFSTFAISDCGLNGTIEITT